MPGIGYVITYVTPCFTTKITEGCFANRKDYALINTSLFACELRFQAILGCFRKNEACLLSKFLGLLSFRVSDLIRSDGEAVSKSFNCHWTPHQNQCSTGLYNRRWLQRGSDLLVGPDQQFHLARTDFCQY